MQRTHGLLNSEERIGGQLEALAAVWLQAKQAEVTLHATLGDAGLARPATHAPVGRAVGRLGCATWSSSAAPRARRIGRQCADIRNPFATCQLSPF